MLKLTAWCLAALTLSVAACGGDSDSEGGGGTVTAVGCDWFSGPSCWNAAAAAAALCTDSAATGTLDATTTTCTYDDGVTVEFDPSATATACAHQAVPWNFTVLSASATTCARYVEVPGVSKSLTTSLGTVTVDASGVTCPDGNRFALAEGLVCAVVGGWVTAEPEGTIALDVSWSSIPAGPLWQCR